ncbi:nitroreductase family protein [Rhodococcus sp. SMB37]|uniref:nitroreductase family protein n=1 Tax=Rhodococcus sp. SMB37 TaxID=2512213 RepID=UPI001045BE6B|nr:nitroreductase family protein [Rhodococcus sp. SMB37]TCN52686.1 nitroreductase family protein [Rhodococcus sp. SMB37]
MTVDSETWSPSDTEIIARAVIEAPSVHDTQPWNLTLPGSAAELEERLEFAEPGADPLRPDRLISCGTAVAHLELAMRVLGRQVRTDLCPFPDRPAVIARIETLGTSVPDSSDLRLYAAISRRKSHREAFTDIPVPAETIGDVVAAGAQVPGVGIRLLASDEAQALADMLTYSAEAKRRNPHYQREMFSWTSHWQPEGNAEVVEGWDATLDEHGAAGKAMITTDVPDTSALATAIDRETVLLFYAASADPIDLVRIGMATERAWLAAVDARLSASVLTHPLRIEDSADRLGARLGMATPPQLIMRIGY